jgi:hypothetical protein
VSSAARFCAALATAAALLPAAHAVRAGDLDLGAEAPASSVAWSGDLLVREDLFRSHPGGDNVTRTWARLRFGPTWQIDEQWTLAAAARVNESTQSNEYVVNDNDNERARDLALDKLFLSYAPTPNDEWVAGKTALPLKLSLMVWDPVLRPAGLSFAHQTDFGDHDSLRFVGGVFRGEFMFGDQSRITALQADLRLHEDGVLQPEFVLSYLHFTDLDALLAAGEDRGNPFVGSHFIDNYAIVDGQFILHVAGDTPMRLLLDLVHNSGAATDNQAARLEFALGDSFRAGGQEVGVAVQRIQQSAVLGAFNSEDWWFHAGTHGDHLWYAYGVSDDLRLRAGFFWEQPDGAAFHTRRLLLDMQWKF